MTRHFLRAVCRATVAAVLLAQLAIAAYACPMLATSGTPAADIAAVATADAEAMNCDQMAAVDAAQPNLCAAHCQYGQQSDQASTLSVLPVYLTARYSVAPAVERADALPRAAAAPSAQAAAPPPHAILHCCFQI